MKYLTNRKLWAAIIGLVTAFGTLMVTLDEAKANTTFRQGSPFDNFTMSEVVNGTCHSAFGYTNTAMSLVRAGWNERNYSNVEIWFTGTSNSFCTPSVGFNSPKLMYTGPYVAGTVKSYGPVGNQGCICTYKVVFDTNINGTLDTTGMDSANWTPTTDGTSQYQSKYVTYSSSTYTKLDGANNLFGVYKTSPISGKYQIGVGSTVATTDKEIYFFYQYWEGGVLKRTYMQQSAYNGSALTDNTVWTAIYSNTKIEANKIILAGTVAKVAGRTYYVKVDNTLNGSPDSGYDIEIPALP